VQELGECLTSRFRYPDVLYDDSRGSPYTGRNFLCSGKSRTTKTWGQRFGVHTAIDIIVVVKVV
jgi:hypothetical protein